MLHNSSPTRVINRATPTSSACSPEATEAAVIEWLLYDDQVMRECFRHAAAIAKHVTGAQIAAVTLLDKEHQHYRASIGMTMPPVPRKSSLCDHAIQNDELFVVEDAFAQSHLCDCTLVRSAPFVRFYAAAPIHAPGGEVVGALCAMDPSPRQINDDQRAVLEHLRAMIENDLRLRTATAVDPLTQLFNRRFMLENIRQRWHEAADGDQFGTAMIDVDWFKQYNDTYGHQAGDICLRAVASVLQREAEEHQMICGRLGGEEFALLRSGPDRFDLENALENVRAGVEGLAIEHRRSPFGIVTISIGASVTRKQHQFPAAHRERFAIADRALYAAKEHGRNRVVMAG